MLVLAIEALKWVSFACFGAALLLAPVAAAGGAAFVAESAKERKRGWK